MSVDYSAPAELFPGKRAGINSIRYRRFPNAAEAIRYAIEDMHRDLLNGAMLEINERRYPGAQIRGLYDAPAYPLKRVAEAEAA
jgi:hypothetical protein